MNTTHFFTGRNSDRTRLWAAVTTLVAGQDDYYLAPDLSNVIALVELDSLRGETVVHAMDEGALTAVFDITPEELATEALALSDALDQGRNADPEYQVPDDAPKFAGDAVTYFMTLDA